MRQSLGVLDKVEDSALEAIMVGDHEEADQLLSCADIVNIAR